MRLPYPAGRIPPGRDVDTVSLRRGAVIALTPRQSIQHALAMLPDDGGTVLLGEGEYLLEGGVSTTKPVALIGLGRVVVKSAKNYGSSRAWLVTLLGDRSQLVGVEFTDSYLTTGHAVMVGGDYSIVRDCRFTDAYRAMSITGNKCVVAGCVVEGVRASDAAVQVYSDDCSISGNVVLTSATADVAMTATAQRIAFTGNVTNTHSYYGANGCSLAGNTGTPSVL